jgi:hypothetical protein
MARVFAEERARMKKIAIGAAALALLVLAGCGKAGIVHIDILKDGYDQVRLSRELDRAGSVVPRGYDHPRSWTEAQLTQVLSKIQYQEYAFFTWRKARPVFVEQELAKLAPALARALGRATADEWIDFSVTARKRDYLWPTPRVTDGMAFVQGGKLQLVLGNLNFEIIDADQRATGDPRKRFAVETYRLVVGPNVARPPVVPKDPLLRREHSNWAVLDVAAILAPPPVETPPSLTPGAPEESAKERTIKARLEELKSLLNEGLITPEEYDRKKKEILESL